MSPTEHSTRSCFPGNLTRQDPLTNGLRSTRMPTCPSKSRAHDSIQKEKATFTLAPGLQRSSYACTSPLPALRGSGALKDRVCGLSLGDPELLRDASDPAPESSPSKKKLLICGRASLETRCLNIVFVDSRPASRRAGECLGAASAGVAVHPFDRLLKTNGCKVESDVHSAVRFFSM